MSNNPLTGIKTAFKSNAIEFISEYYKLENKEVPDFESLSSDKVLSIYSKEVKNLNAKLLMNRSKPSSKYFLTSLGKLYFLPKSSRIILDSIINNE